MTFLLAIIFDSMTPDMCRAQAQKSPIKVERISVISETRECIIYFTPGAVEEYRRKIRGQYQPEIRPFTGREI